MGSYVAGFKRIYVGVFDNKAEKVTELYTWEDDKGGTCLLYTSPSPRD